jgi:molybdopterin converting factor subunit 1
MQVSVQLFAAARDRVGRTSIQVELGERGTVKELRSRLRDDYPQLHDIVSRAMIAVDTEYARDDQQIRASSEVALIPPVSGG